MWQNMESKDNNNKGNIKDKKTIKFHGQEVENIVLLYLQKIRNEPDKTTIEEFDAIKDLQACDTINVQVVSEFVTITFYKDEKTNSIVHRELIPTNRVEHIWIRDMQT
jgi:hypothetical protein